MTSHICQRVNTGESYIFYFGAVVIIYQILKRYMVWILHFPKSFLGSVLPFVTEIEWKIICAKYLPRNVKY